MHEYEVDEDEHGVIAWTYCHWFVTGYFCSFLPHPYISLIGGYAHLVKVRVVRVVRVSDSVV